MGELRRLSYEVEQLQTQVVHFLLCHPKEKLKCGLPAGQPVGLLKMDHKILSNRVQLQLHDLDGQCIHNLPEEELNEETIRAKTYAELKRTTLGKLNHTLDIIRILLNPKETSPIREKFLSSMVVGDGQEVKTQINSLAFKVKTFTLTADNELSNQRLVYRGTDQTAADVDSLQWTHLLTDEGSIKGLIGGNCTDVFCIRMVTGSEKCGDNSVNEKISVDSVYNASKNTPVDRSVYSSNRAAQPHRMSATVDAEMLLGQRSLCDNEVFSLLHFLEKTFPPSRWSKPVGIEGGVRPCSDIQLSYVAADFTEYKEKYTKTGAEGFGKGCGDEYLQLLHKQHGGQGDDGYPDVGDSRSGKKLALLKNLVIKDVCMKKAMIDVMGWGAVAGARLKKDGNCLGMMANTNTCFGTKHNNKKKEKSYEDIGGDDDEWIETGDVEEEACMKALSIQQSGETQDVVIKVMIGGLKESSASSLLNPVVCYEPPTPPSNSIQKDGGMKEGTTETDEQGDAKSHSFSLGRSCSEIGEAAGHGGIRGVGEKEGECGDLSLADVCPIKKCNAGTGCVRTTKSQEVKLENDEASGSGQGRGGKVVKTGGSSFEFWQSFFCAKSLLKKISTWKQSCHGTHIRLGFIKLSLPLVLACFLCSSTMAVVGSEEISGEGAIGEASLKNIMHTSLLEQARYENESAGAHVFDGTDETKGQNSDEIQSLDNMDATHFGFDESQRVDKVGLNLRGNLRQWTGQQGNRIDGLEHMHDKDTIIEKVDGIQEEKVVKLNLRHRVGKTPEEVVGWVNERHGGIPYVSNGELESFDSMELSNGLTHELPISVEPARAVTTKSLEHSNGLIYGPNGIIDQQKVKNDGSDAAQTEEHAGVALYADSEGLTGLSNIRKVRVQLDDKNYLGMYEVKVIDHMGTNVAEGKEAQQSSTYSRSTWWNGDQRYPAGNAVDGNPLDYSKTESEQGAWWEVDLGTEMEVKEVMIQNDFDLLDPDVQRRLSGSKVILKDNDGIPVAMYHIGLADINIEIPADSFTTLIKAQKVRVQLGGTNFLNMVEVQVLDYLDTDIAVNKEAEQSSTYGSYPARKAVNGILDQGDFSQTQNEQGAWWEVDLGSDAMISAVKIFNRNNTHTIQSRLSQSNIILKDGEGIPVATYQIESAGSIIEVPANTFKRLIKACKVRVQLDGKEALNLVEVQVLDYLGANVAQGMGAEQSSTLGHYNAGKAIDGITDQDDFSHTYDEQGAWWEVDLGSDVMISAVKIHNRISNIDRLSQSKVFLKNSEGIPVAMYQIKSASSDIEVFADSFTKYNVIKVHKVRVQVDGTSILNMVEVQVLDYLGTNVAKGMEAYQSSVYSDSTTDYTAEKAVDGIVDQRDYSRTNDEQGAWWEVDLGMDVMIERVKIHNRHVVLLPWIKSRLSQSKIILKDGDENIVGMYQIGEAKSIIDIPADTFKTCNGNEFTSGIWCIPKVRVQLDGTNFLNMVEVQVLDYSGTDIAVNKKAEQSSTNSSYPAWKAVNGILDQGDFSATQNEQGAWWEVDLGSDAMISAVTIFNRNNTHTVQSRLSQSNVILKKRDGTPVATYPIGSAGSVIDILADSFMGVTGMIKAQYVRVQLDGKEALNLVEVQVLDYLGANVAQGMGAEQSSTIGHYNAGKAIDGIIDQNEFSHTDDEQGAWWEVDLGSDVMISTVKIHNRISNIDRLSQSKVFLKDGEGNVIATYQITFAENVINLASTSFATCVDRRATLGTWCNHPGASVIEEFCNGEMYLRCGSIYSQTGYIRCSDGLTPSSMEWPSGKCPSACENRKSTRGEWCSSQGQSISEENCNGEMYLKCADIFGNTGYKRCRDGLTPPLMELPSGRCPLSCLNRKLVKSDWCVGSHERVTEENCNGNMYLKCSNASGQTGYVKCSDDSVPAGMEWPSGTCPSSACESRKANRGNWCTLQGQTVGEENCNGENYIKCTDTSGKSGYMKCSDGPIQSGMEWPSGKCPFACDKRSANKGDWCPPSEGIITEVSCHGDMYLRCSGFDCQVTVQAYDPHGYPVGTYFKYDSTVWTRTFGPVGTDGSIFRVQQLRNGNTVYTGNVKVWNNDAHWDRREYFGRMEPDGGGHFQNGDMLVNPDCCQVTVQAYNPLYYPVGTYFKYDSAVWTRRFGPVGPGTDGTIFPVQQLRNDNTVYTGKVKVWKNDVFGDRREYFGRTEPVGGGNFQNGDMLVNPDCCLVTVQAYNPPGYGAGTYFKYDSAVWTRRFGPVGTGMDGTIFPVQQLRNDNTVYTGNVKVWNNDAFVDRREYFGRTEPNGGGHFQNGDMLVNPDCNSIDLNSRGRNDPNQMHMKCSDGSFPSDTEFQSVTCGEVTSVPTGNFCGIDTNSLGPFLDPPKEVTDLLGATLGIGWGISPVAQFSDYNEACAELEDMFNSTDDFIVVSVSGEIGTGLITGDDAKSVMCEREKAKKNSNTCDVVKNGEDPLSKVTDFLTFLPICVALRPCDSANQMGRQITFGLVAGGTENGGDGVLIFDGKWIPPPFGPLPIQVFFQGVAFDTAGTLVFPGFTAPLINPSQGQGGDSEYSPLGMHYWVRGYLSFPLTGMIGGKKTEFASVGVTAQMGFYSEMEIGGETTSDIVSFLTTLGDIDALKNKVENFDRVTVQMFFDAEAEVEVDLSKLFPIPEDSSISVKRAISSMLEVNFGQKPAPVSSLSSLDEISVTNVWYESLGKDGYHSNTHSFARDLCTSKGEKLATLSQICPQGPLHGPIHGHKYGNQWTPYDDCDNCWVQVGTHGTCRTYHDLHDSMPSWGQNPTVAKPFAKYTLCVADDSNTTQNEVSKLSHMISHLRANDEVIENLSLSSSHKGQGSSHLRVDDWIANSYLSFWLSVQQSLDISSILSPLGEFGDFIGGMLPTISVTLQQYVKVPLSGLAQFILGFVAEVSIDCQPLADIGKAIQLANSAVYDQVWPSEVTGFCDAKDGRSASAKISIGFKGYYPDPPNTFIQLATSFETDEKIMTPNDIIQVAADTSSQADIKISMDMLPTCPPPVKLGGKCSLNTDCKNHPDDPDAAARYEGYCKNGIVANIGTSIGCSGTCIEKLDAGGDCSKKALNVIPFDFPWDAEHEACKSGRCLCGTCARLRTSRIPIGGRCSQNTDCEDDWCEASSEGASTAKCQGTCRPRRQNGDSCFNGDANSCRNSNQCTCGVCGDKQTATYCSTNDNCASGWCEASSEGAITTGCAGQCKPKRLNGDPCFNGDANSCRDSDQCTCGLCGSKQPNGKSCSTNDNCSSDWCQAPWEGASTSNCQGTCQRQREDGESCFNGDANSCRTSDQCTCGLCGSKLPNTKSCSTNDNCSSHWCQARWQGAFTSGCQGTCQRRRENGESCFNGDASSCRTSSQCTCGLCGSKQPNGKSCSTNANCLTNWCQGGFSTAGCQGTCQRKRNDGEWCHSGDGKSCRNPQCTCGRCGYKLPNGYKCSTDNNCRSGNCKGPWWGGTLGCNGTCG